MMGSLVLLWFVSYLFFLNPWNKEIQRSQQKIRSLKENIGSLYQGEESFGEEIVAEKEEQNQKLKTRIQELVQKLQWEGVVNKTSSVLEFRSQYDQKKDRLQQEANKAGISVDESLGFPRSLPPSIHEKYWISMELGSYLISQLLQSGNKEDSLKSIDKIYYPKLEEALEEKKFLVEYPVEITITCSYSFLIKAIHRFSQPPSLKIQQIGFPLLTITEMVVLAGKEGLIESKVRFVAWKINPEGEIAPDAEKKQTPVAPQNIPIWERY